MLDTLRKPLFFAAIGCLFFALIIEVGSSLFFSAFEIPGFGISYMALVDGLLFYVVANMGVSMIVPERIQGRVQGFITLIISLLVLLLSIGLLIAAILALTLMVSLFFAIPFGTAVYFTTFADFQRAGAAVTLSLLMSLKLAFAICLVLSHQRFLQIKSLVFLILTSLVINVLVNFLQAFPPGFLVRITDALAAVIVAILAIIWSLGFVFLSMPAIVKALRVDRALS